ncbi:MAG TPA: YqhG family protein [Candidatus Bathyarchaeia archaeon]|nr:YqhG family protein [Candidatus Bathyarchaeia archaeon]
MNQQEVRSYIERYFAAFSTHIVETHPHYFTVKLPVEVDKDIGNRPFYWSWVEKMNLPYQPMVLTFIFQPDQVGTDIRGEQIHFGASRLQQIFQSAANHGRFVCMYEHHPAMISPLGSGTRRSNPLTPWLGLNVKISFICDKKKDLLLYLGVNLYQPRVVHNFYPFLQRLQLQPSIPAYYYTQAKTISLEQGVSLLEQEINRVIQQQDSRWAMEARERLHDEWEILEAYYTELALREKTVDEEEQADESPEEAVSPPEEEPVQEDRLLVNIPEDKVVEPVALPATIDEVRAGGGRLLDFLRAHSIPETPKSEINQGEWKKSTPQEEKERRMEELRWQYEPRIEVNLINGGIFYLHNMPPFH